MLINLISYLIQNGEKMSSNVLFGPQLKYIFIYVYLRFLQNV